ncbi:MAG TPA: ABC transporter permease subunit [Pseudonocardiaceae bacterium]|nr:ABC transporter permease subunit [Pseudonocardiaceae bacterium]
MTTPTITPYRSELPAGRDGFGQLLRSEWTKFRTVRGWVVGTVIAVLATVLIGVLTAKGSMCSVGPFPGQPVGLPCTGTIGVGGGAVSDTFNFVHQPMTGNGSITVRLTSLTGEIPVGPLRPDAGANERPGLQPWSKAGIIIKQNTTEGSAYAAVLATGAHGIRMQSDFTQDTAGLAGAVSPTAPRWLRLTRSGDTLTGYDSTDGTHWSTIGSTRLAGLSATVQAGVFATSPAYVHVVSQSFGGSSGTGGPTQATGVFDHVELSGTPPGAGWTDTGLTDVAEPQMGAQNQFHQNGGELTVSGSGDIAPAVVGGTAAGSPIETTLGGAFAGLIALIVVGTMFVTAEYRRGLIRTSLVASPRRGRVLAAKGVVLGGIAFVAALLGVVIAVPIDEHLLRANGNFIDPAPTVADARVLIGTAAVLAVAAVFALGVGVILRRSAGVVAVVIAVFVLPRILATAGVLSTGASEWLLRVTPAAGFAIQQSLPQYSQVDADYSPAGGYYPLPPLAGFAVLCGWTALVLGLAFHLLRRRDA